MADIASLGLELDSRGFTQGMAQAAQAANSLGQATDQVSAKVRVSNGQMDDTAKIMRAQAEAARQAAQANLALNGSTNQLSLGQVHFLETLEEQAALYGRSTTEALRYKAAMMGVSDAAEPYIQKIEQAAAAQDKHGISLSGNRSKIELLRIANDLATNQYARMESALMVLGNATGASTVLFSAAGVAIATMIAPLAVMALAAHQGRTELEALNAALSYSSGYSGQTADSIRQLAERMSASSTMTVGAARTISAALASSGEIGSQAFAKIAMMAGQYAKATGETTDQVSKDLIRMFSDPVRGLEEFDSKTHSVSSSQLELVRALQNSGDKMGAQSAAADAMSEHLAKQAKEVTGLAKTWDNVTKAMSAYWQGLKDSMSGDAYLDKLNDMNKGLAMLMNSPMANSDLGKKQIQDQKDRIALFKQQHDAQAAADKAQIDAMNKQKDLNDAVYASSQKSITAQINAAQRELALLSNPKAPQSVDADERKVELRKQIADLTRSMGAEDRQLTQLQLTDAAQYNLLVLTGQASRLQNQLNYGAITKEQFDAGMTQNALDKNAIEQNFELDMSRIAGLTAADRQSHANKLKYLREQAVQIAENGKAQLAIDEKKPQTDYMDALGKAAQDQLKSLDAEIEKERQHGSEIGKTKEQVDALRSAQEQQKAVALQSQVNATEDMLGGLDPNNKALDNARAIYTQWLADTKARIVEINTLAQVRSDNANADAIAKASSDLDKYLDPTKARSFGDALTGSLSGAARSMSDLTRAMERYSVEQEKNDKARAEAQLEINGNDEQRAKGLADLAQVNDRDTKIQIDGYANMASAAAGFFDQGSRGYKALQTASQVMHAAELAMNLASIAPAMAAGAAQFFAQSGWGGFAGVAAMAAVVAGFGVAISGGGSAPSSVDRQAAQGTGTILGDSNAKSDSISKSIELTAANSDTQINYLSGMLTSLQAIQTGIGSFASQLVQSTNISNPDVGNLSHGYGTTNLGAADMTATGAEIGSYFGPIGTAVGAVLGYISSKIPVFQNLFTSIMGGKQSVADSGFTVDSNSLGAILASGANARSYADITTSGGWFGSDKTSTQTQALGADANQQFTSIIRSMAAGITEAGSLLGVSGDDFTNKLDSFVVDIGKVSLKGLTGDEIQKQLEAVFSKLGDQMAQAAIPDLQQFEQVGEGYLQTLVRVASDYAKVDASLQSIGKTFGSVGIDSIAARENLVGLLGGIDKFQSATSDYAKNFLTKGQQLAPVATYVTQQLTSMNLGWVSTREQFAGVIQCLDLTTQSGRDTYASLMNLESAFAATHAAIVDTTMSAQDIADQHKTLQDKLDDLTMSSIQLHEKERATIDASNLALYDRVSALQAEKDASQSLLGDVDNAFTVLQNTTKTTTDAISARITAEQALSDAIKSTLSSMGSQTASLTDRKAAEAQIKAAIASVQAGGALPTADSLKDALSTVQQDASQQFTTYADYLKDLYGTKSDLTKLGSLTDSALSVDQKQLNSLNDMLAAAQKQIDLLKGIDTSGLTIAQALAGFQLSLASAQANPVASATGAITSAYQSALGRAPDAAGLAYYQQAAASGGSISDITSSIANSPEASIQKLYQSLLGRPADAGGLQFYVNSGESIAQIAADIKGSNEYKALHPFAIGTNFVPETMPALVHQGERIIPAADNRALMARLSSPSENNAALLAELKALRQEVAQLREKNSAENVAQVKQLQAQVDLLGRVIYGGDSVQTTVIKTVAPS